MISNISPQASRPCIVSTALTRLSEREMCTRRASYLLSYLVCITARCTRLRHSLWPRRVRYSSRSHLSSLHLPSLHSLSSPTTISTALSLIGYPSLSTPNLLVPLNLIPALPCPSPLSTPFSSLPLPSPVYFAEHKLTTQLIQTVTGVTGGAGAPVGNALTSLGNGVQDGGDRVAKGVKDAGAGKKEWW